MQNRPGSAPAQTGGSDELLQGRRGGLQVPRRGVPGHQDPEAHPGGKARLPDLPGPGRREGRRLMTASTTSVPHFRMYIGGQWVDTDARYELANPANEQLVAT